MICSKNNKRSDADSFSTPEWMIFADQRSLFASFESLLYAFNDIESVLEDIIEEGHIIGEYTPEFPTYQRLSSDFITLYNECEYLTKNHRARLNNKDLTYLRHLRRLCAHRFGISMDTSRFLLAAQNDILPMKESIRSMMFEVLNENPNPNMEQRVKSFNIRNRFN